MSNNVKRNAALKGLASRWGNSPREKAVRIRVSRNAYEALEQVPDHYRREVASEGIVRACKEFMGR